MPARYTDTPERSAELLRATLRLLGQHRACWNPLAFTVLYEYAAGMNKQLAEAVDARLKAQPALTDEDITQLHQAHIAEADQASIELVSRQLQQVMTGMAENASSTGVEAGSFSAQVDQLAGALTRASAHELPDLLASTASRALALKGKSDGLAQQLQDGQREIERLRSDLDRARDEALLDPLTRVLNRRGFDQRLDALMQLGRCAERGHSLVMIDIDHFKVVNDTHGHVVGDQVIHGLAEVLRRSVPQAEQRVARYGGEEFAILLPHTRANEGALLAEEVLQRVRAMRIKDRRTQQVVLSVTVSAGVAELRDGDDPTSWIARADGALYRAKSDGRDRVTRAEAR